MFKPRLIPCLLISDEKLVKTKQFKSPKYVGDPLNVVKIFNEKEVDEIMILDISATKKNKAPNFNLIRNITSECFMPLSYGGGINSIDDATKLFDIGVEKLIFQNSFYINPSLIKDLSLRFGSQSIVISIDLKKTWNKKIKPFFYYKKKFFNTKLEELFKKAYELGAGEIFLQIVHKEGTRSGADLSCFPKNLTEFPLPIVIAGGVSSLKDVKSYLKIGADAVGAGAFFIFKGPQDAVLISYPQEVYNDQYLN